MPIGVIEEIENGDRCPHCGFPTKCCSANDFFNTEKNMKGIVKYCKQCDAYAYEMNGMPHKMIADKKLRDSRNLCVQYYNCLVRKKMQKNKQIDLHLARYKLNGWIAKMLKINPKIAYPQNFNDKQCDVFLKASQDIIKPTELISLDNSNF